MSSSAAGQPSFDISDEDTLLFRETYRMESADQCRIKATVRPEMSVPKSDRYVNAAAEQMNASATELTKKMLIGEERLDYMERAQRREPMRDPVALKIQRSKLLESFLPRAEAEENFFDSGLEIYRDEDRNNLFETAEKFRKSQIKVLNSEHKQLNTTP